MTTYSTTVTLSETEMWALEAAMKFYVTPEATQLREDNPELQPWYGPSNRVLKEMLADDILKKGMFMSSTSTFCWPKSE